MYQLDLSCATGVSSHLCVPGKDTLSLYRLAQTETAPREGSSNEHENCAVANTSCMSGAASLDMSAVTCERFLQTTDSRTLPIVVGWLIGRHATSDVHAAIDFDKADRSSAELLKVCGDNPSLTVSAAGERLHY